MKRISVLAGAVFALFTSGSAFAYDLAYTTTTANMRSGPTVVSRIVASSIAIRRFNVDNCSGGWCFAHIAGRTGYISSSLLEFNADAPPPRVVERTYVSRKSSARMSSPSMSIPTPITLVQRSFSVAAVRTGMAAGTMAGIITAGTVAGWHHWRR